MDMKPNEKYADIIDLPRPVSKKRSPMSNHDRAAQFSPFAALTGYDAVIAETGRLTDTQAELDEGGKQLLDEKLQLILAHLEENPWVSLQVFCPDSRKSGGEYRQISGHVKKIDSVTRCMVLTEGEVIPIDRIYGIESALTDDTKIDPPEDFYELPL
jgi:hypothetical protein